MNAKIVKFDEENAPDIIRIRSDVFVDEQGIDSKIDFDGLDEIATHVLIFSQNKAIATGRMLDDGHIGRIAVSKEYRQQGVGTKVLQALLAEAKKQGLAKVYLGSQIQAVDFYKKLGFDIYGEVFMDAGIEHIEMALYL